MKLNYPSIFATLLVASLLPAQVFAAKPIKPPPPPVTAEDVICDGCVDTTDIEDGAVTKQKLSTEVNDLLETISQLQTRLDELEAQQPTPVAKIYADTVLMGYTSLHKVDQGEQLFLYEPTSGYFITLKNATSSGTSTYSLSSSDIKYETFDCTGQGIVAGGGASGTANVLIVNGASFYRTMGSTIDPRPIITNSIKDKVTEVCSINLDSISNEGLSLVEPIAYPLPYSLPISIPAFSFRMEYAAP